MSHQKGTTVEPMGKVLHIPYFMFCRPRTRKQKREMYCEQSTPFPCMTNCGDPAM